MAIEFGSRKENFDNFKVYETTLAGRPFKVEMGKMCGLSNASALIRYGETCVMCNVVVLSPKPRRWTRRRFLPPERGVRGNFQLYAAGRIPGSFMRREGRPRPGERAHPDQPRRGPSHAPAVHGRCANDVVITMTVMSLGRSTDGRPALAGPEIAAPAAARSALRWSPLRVEAGDPPGTHLRLPVSDG